GVEHCVDRVRRSRRFLLRRRSPTPSLLLPERHAERQNQACDRRDVGLPLFRHLRGLYSSLRKNRFKPAPTEPTPNPRSRTDLWICAALFAGMLAVYVQVAQFGFLNFDDPDYVTNNPHAHAESPPKGSVGHSLPA